ncbi:MAG: phosphatase PAP2 family protein [Clostridia bacterium]|nr:phosphatase PAP2 family protein [Clostridia bacterium]
MIKILKAVARDEKRMRLLKLISKVSSYTLAAFFACQIILELMYSEYLECILAVSSSAVGFVGVTVLRSTLNFKRPYEVYDFYEVPPREISGRSFPSRHTYSGFVIATLSWLISPMFFAGLMILAVAIALCRVFAGIHFLRDVTVGAAIGIFHGVVPIIICHLV